MRERVARSRELARGRRPAVVARVMQVTRQAIYRTPRPRRSPQRQPAKGPVDATTVEVARDNPTDGTRMVAALASREIGDLTSTAQDDELWRWMPAPRPRDARAMRALVRAALAEWERGERLPFAILDQESGRAIGSTSYMDIAPDHRALEIGWTWLGRPWWRTAHNTEAKLLLLRHAFGVLGVNRVALRTDHRDARSQAAIARLGAVREGSLRQHRRRPDGSFRDTVYFSILAEDWPQVERRLVERLGAARPLIQTGPCSSGPSARTPRTRWRSCGPLRPRRSRSTRRRERRWRAGFGVSPASALARPRTSWRRRAVASSSPTAAGDRWAVQASSA